MLYALAHLGLARSKALMNDTASAREAYGRMLDLWKSSDPQLAAARRSSRRIRSAAVDQTMADKKSGPPDALFPVIYGELRHVARRYLGRERRNHTLQPTALVHEAWLRLQNDRGGEWEGRTHGLALGAQAMRRLLIDHGRHQKRDKRGGGVQPVALDDFLRRPKPVRCRSKIC